jgi:hypothetical protein
VRWSLATDQSYKHSNSVMVTTHARSEDHCAARPCKFARVNNFCVIAPFRPVQGRHCREQTTAAGNVPTERGGNGGRRCLSPHMRPTLRGPRNSFCGCGAIDAQGWNSLSLPLPSRLELVLGFSCTSAESASYWLAVGPLFVWPRFTLAPSAL